MVRSFFLALTLVSASAAAGPAFPALTTDGLPNIQSASAVVVDLDTGARLYEKNTGDIRKIASTGKVFVALVARRRGIDLDGETTITKEDAALAKGGARTRLAVGQSFRNIDLLRAMLIASDNRAPSAIGRAVGLAPSELVHEMNSLASEFQLQHTSFTDCSGLHGNESTAPELATALSHAIADPVIASILQTPSVEVQSTSRPVRRIHYRNTNRTIHSGRYEILGGKTGFTDDAGYCLAVAARVGEQRIGMIFLGAPQKLTRFGDFRRVIDWLAE